METEPALVIAGCGAVAAVALDAAIAFGLPVTPDQKLALVALGTSLVTVLTGLVTRSQVSSPHTVAKLVAVAAATGIAAPA
jgi:hypothetical protein